MNCRLLPVVLFVLGATTIANAQTKDKVEKKPKKENITIHRDKDSKEKMTIVIDGDNITVNGKPLSEIKDLDINITHDDDFGPMTRFRSVGPRGGVKMFADEFPFGENSRAFLGVVSKKDDKGAKITEVEEESAAEKAGLKKDDIITKVGDTKIADSEELYDAIGKFKPEEKVTITYLRDGKEAQATATLAKSNFRMRAFNFDGDNFNRNFNFKMPNLEGLRGLERFEGLEGLENLEYLRRPRLGVSIQDIEEGKGIKVTDVDDESAAEKAGLKKDDIITAIDGKTVNSVDELKNGLKGLKEGSSVKLTYQRNGKTETATISFPKKIKTAEL
jgi:serine protease Do